MRSSLLLSAVIALSALLIGGPIFFRQTGFDRCLRIISSDIQRHAGSATLDPDDVEVQAARLCAGAQ